MGKSYMRKVKQKVDLTIPCKCGTGFYCHRHLKYGVSDDNITPVLKRIKRGKGQQRPKYKPSNGGEH